MPNQNETHRADNPHGSRHTYHRHEVAENVFWFLVASGATVAFILTLSTAN